MSKEEKPEYKFIEPVSEQTNNEIRRQGSSPMSHIQEGPVELMTVNEIIEKYGDLLNAEQRRYLESANKALKAQEIDFSEVKLPLGAIVKHLESKRKAMSKTIDIKAIYHQFIPKDGDLEFHTWMENKIFDAMREAVRQALELSCDNIDGLDSGWSADTFKDFIRDTIKQVV